VPAEVVPLVDSFNRVLERREQGYRVQQEFLATAAAPPPTIEIDRGGVSTDSSSNQASPS